ncbi:hypothetical protein ACIBCT_20895 [Streptosporangium sp. NPDC050855]|uniref:hypothetical protein n=1 Tax=Streptosporangium sp. NPDC050855 TaxID=3366194 RepID=UPI0037B8C3C4
MTNFAGAVRAARALRHGYLQAVEERDIEALIANLANWMSTDPTIRAAVLADERKIA